jgi:hypothetical protein
VSCVGPRLLHGDGVEAVDVEHTLDLGQSDHQAQAAAGDLQDCREDRGPSHTIAVRQVREVIVPVDQQVTQLVDRQRTVLVGKVAS